MDIRKFFDNLLQDLTLRAGAHHPKLGWVLLYVERWLKAPLQLEDGSLVERSRGTAQGSAISPLLANMFLDYAFDAWLARECRGRPFERYCDEHIAHARSERQVPAVAVVIASRQAECGLSAHEHKTRVVSCKDDDRRGSCEHTSVDLLLRGPPAAIEEQVGKRFVKFSPAISSGANTRLRQRSPPCGIDVG